MLWLSILCGADNVNTVVCVCVRARAPGDLSGDTRHRETKCCEILQLLFLLPFYVLCDSVFRSL